MCLVFCYFENYVTILCIYKVTHSCKWLRTSQFDSVCQFIISSDFRYCSIYDNQLWLRSFFSANAVYNGTPGNIFTNTSSFFDLENEDQNEVAVDAHYLIAEFYDVLRDEFDWLGLDNNDRAMEAIIHAGDFINASWNGSHASFGNGDCNHGPLVTAEVVSHEFMPVSYTHLTLQTTPYV